MDKEPDLTTEDPAVIREQIEETRSSLTEKLETLEHEVKETVSEAKAAVSGTVEAVKETVQETVENVKQTFDLRYQMEERPWLLLGGTLLAGFLAGRWMARESTVLPSLGMAAPSPVRPSYASQPNGASSAPAEFQPSEPGLVERFTDTFHDEIDKLKGLGIGLAMSLLRDAVTRSLPENLAPRLGEVMDRVTTKLGGEPMRGPVLESMMGESAGSRADQQRSPAMAGLSRGALC